MHLDPYTSILASACITMATSVSILFFSLTRKENRFFLWAALASGGLATAQLLQPFRGRIPDFFTIVVGEQLSLFCLIAFYVALRHLLSVRFKQKIIASLLLVIQSGLIVYYTYYDPNQTARGFIISCSFCILTASTLKLLLQNPPREQLRLYIFFAIPFLLLFLISILNTTSLFMGKKLIEDPLALPHFPLVMICYGIESIWLTLSLVFIVSSRLQIQVTEMALTDSLTGILNRRALQDAMEREMARARRTGNSLSLIITDLDHFKKVNDTYGHQAGDAILTHTVDSYNKILRTEDVLARYGGEEFVVILPGADIKMAINVAERLRWACKNNTLLFEGQSIPVTSSFGVAVFPDHGSDYEALIKSADEALYRAKKEGRDRVVAFED